MTGATAATVGVVAALPAEARWLAKVVFLKNYSDWLPVRLVIRVSGVGADAARRAAATLIAEGTQALVSWGTAAGLDAAVVPGTVVIADRVLSDGAALAPSEYWGVRVANAMPKGGPFVRGTVACPLTVLRTSAAKRALASATGAIAADMESAEIARAAQAAGLPWIVVRAISDGVDDAMPASIAGAIDDRGALRWSRLIGGLVRRPADVRAFPALARGMRAAAGAMSHAAHALAVTSIDPSAPEPGRWALVAPERV